MPRRAEVLGYWGAGVCGLALAMLLAGCDKLPWAPKEDEATATTASPATSAQSALAPTRPVVSDFDVVATVNGVPLSKADLRLRLTEEKLTRRVQGRSDQLTDDEIEGILRFLMESELASQEAVKRGLDRDPDIQQRWEYLRRTFFSTQWVLHRRKQLEDELTEEALSRYFDLIKAGFRTPERRRVRQIVLTSEAEANQALAQLLSGAERFEDVARRISNDQTTKASGGLIDGWVLKEDDMRVISEQQAKEWGGVRVLSPPLEATAFAIDQVNGLSGRVKGPDGKHYLFQLVERKEGRQPALSEVRTQVKELWISQRIQEDINELVSKGQTGGQITKPSDVSGRLKDVQRAVDEELKVQQ